LSEGARKKIDFFLGLLLFILLPFVLSPPEKTIFQVTDLPEFFCGARLYFQGQAAQIYDPAYFFAFQKSIFPALQDRAIPLYVAPYGLPFLAPFLIFPADLAYQGIKVLMLAAFAGALYLLIGWLKLSSRTFMWLAAILPFWGPAWEAVRIEQLSPFLLLSLIGCIVLLDKKKPAAAALALAPFLLKPHLAAPLCFFLLGGRQLRFCLSFAAVAAVAATLSFLVRGCGLAAYHSYWSLLSTSMTNLQWMAPMQTPTLRGQLLRLPFLAQTTATQISSVIFALLLVAMLFAGWRLRSGDLLRSMVLITIPLGCLLSMHCFAYDLLLLLPPLVLAGKQCLDRAMQNYSQSGWTSLKSKSTIYALIFIAIPILTFSLPFYALIHYVLTLGGSIINWHFFSLAVLTTYLVYCGCGADNRASS